MSGSFTCGYRTYTVRFDNDTQDNPYLEEVGELKGPHQIGTKECKKCDLNGKSLTSSEKVYLKPYLKLPKNWTLTQAKSATHEYLLKLHTRQKDNTVTVQWLKNNIDKIIHEKVNKAVRKALTKAGIWKKSQDETTQSDDFQSDNEEDDTEPIKFIPQQATYETLSKSTGVHIETGKKCTESLQGITW
jgi:hypothetical protein